MGSRRRARILAFQSLFGWEMNRLPSEEIISFDWLDNEKQEKLDDETRNFARLLVQGCLENIEEIDKRIEERLEHWNLERLAKVDLAILRLGCYSLCYQRSIPASVTIDEAIDIAKEFGSDDSYRFINGVLDGIRKNLEKSAE